MTGFQSGCKPERLRESGGLKALVSSVWQLLGKDQFQGQFLVGDIFGEPEFVWVSEKFEGGLKGSLEILLHSFECGKLIGQLYLAQLQLLDLFFIGFNQRRAVRLDDAFKELLDPPLDLAQFSGQAA